MVRGRHNPDGHPVGSGCSVMVLITCGLIVLTGGPTRIGVAFGIACVAGALLLTAFEVTTEIKSRAAARRLAERKERRQCLDCGYPVADLPTDTIACPECGTAIEVSEPGTR
ncbi:MAG TPA: hypothetical protein VD971_03750 [Phycisphaerales bacterium]|nr:hypothetical protein [Phycisphaerales bacterium]